MQPEVSHAMPVLFGPQPSWEEERRLVYYAERKPLRERHHEILRAVERDDSAYLAELARWDDEDHDLRERVFGYRVLRIDEAEAVRGDRAIFNGCTGVYLREAYGDDVFHVMGVGWFVRERVLA